jgi:hypothetical protein
MGSIRDGHVFLIVVALVFGLLLGVINNVREGMRLDNEYRIAQLEHCGCEVTETKFTGK